MDLHEATGLAVRIDAVRRAFAGGVTAIDAITLAIPAGEFVAILGPSGSGKSTLLRLIARLDQPTSGTVQVEGEVGGADARAAADGGSPIAFVFQDAHLLPWRSVLDNAALPLELLGAPRARRLESAREALEQVGLGDALERYPAQLSGGMRMRVSLARALVTNPRLLLLDEPFAALDEITRQRLDEQLRGLYLRRRMTVIFVTHSIPEATFLADRAVVLSRRPARVLLDTPLRLPAERAPELRTDPAYVQHMRVLFEALRQGEEGA